MKSQHQKPVHRHTVISRHYTPTTDDEMPAKRSSGVAKRLLRRSHRTLNGRLEQAVLKTLLYYDIWQYPLTAEELFAFLPVDFGPLERFKRSLSRLDTRGPVLESDGYYFVDDSGPRVVSQRVERQNRAKRFWKVARVAASVMKYFPFVRGVVISGELSKNCAGKESDIDFVVLTEPGRLWICRSLLILFKRIALFKYRKFFCLNYFVSTDHLKFDHENIFFAAEIAQLKPLFNPSLFQRYLSSNAWIMQYFPNFDPHLLFCPVAEERASIVQKMLEWPFAPGLGDRIDSLLQRMMEKVWAKRYSRFDGITRRRILLCTRQESRAFTGDYEGWVLDQYRKKLRRFGLDNQSPLEPNHRRPIAGTRLNRRVVV